MANSEKEEENGADPIMIAKLVHQLIQKGKGLKISYAVGKTDQLLFMRLKKLIGGNLFEKVAHRVWELP